MEKSKLNEEELLEEAVSNIREDRELTYEMLNELRGEMAATKGTHKESGLIVSKYVETLQRSNEQLVKVVSLIKKEKQNSDSNKITKEEMQTILNESRGLNE